ncbi:MAG: 3-hydroxy-3-methylglutaryl CoA synthase [Candidatus Hecatellales archaeon]|nr:MAG: 3-hydroxy-3-methylglutaryl CoA synthase [Candidatus Hecatellales archaeon]
MVGITSYGAYIPKWRLSLEAFSRGKGEKAVAGRDEDSLTMGVAAALDCLNGMDRNSVDAVFFASTTSPFKEKSVSATIATVLDLRRDVLTADFANSLRAGTTALKVAIDMVKAGSARNVLVVAADCRLAAPGTVLEQTFGDGAAALLVGGNGTIAEIGGYHTVFDEIYDVWRRDVDLYVQVWEDRFVYTRGYLRVMREATSKLMEEAGVNPQGLTKAVFYTPDVRRVVELAKGLGLDPKAQLQDPLIGTVGNTGTAHALMLFVAALEEANPGDKLIMASYGNGCDAFLFEVGEAVAKLRGQRRAVKAHLQSKRMVPDYVTYLRWRELVKMPEPRVPMAVSYPSAVAIWRERNRIFPLHGVKCQVCGTIQYPPQRVCVKCGSKDSFEEVRLYDRRGKLFSYSYDFLRGTPIGLVNLEGGGRIFCELTDVDVKELKVDMPVELSFRRLDLWRSDGIYGYFWKAIPVRA